MGFPKGTFAKLQSMKSKLTRKFTYIEDSRKWSLRDYWEADALLLPVVNGSSKLRSDCEEYAMASMRMANVEGFHSRLVVCWDETGDGHCIAEISSDDGSQAYYFDNRMTEVVTRSGLKGYRFYSCSPWNPVPGETRPWLSIQDR